MQENHWHLATMIWFKPCLHWTRQKWLTAEVKNSLRTLQGCNVSCGSWSKWMKHRTCRFCSTLITAWAEASVGYQRGCRPRIPSYLTFTVGTSLLPAPNFSSFSPFLHHPPPHPATAVSPQPDFPSLWLRGLRHWSGAHGFGPGPQYFSDSRQQL